VSYNLNWCPKPFRFNNYWIDHPEFYDFVKHTWENMAISGKKAYVLKEKLKQLKEALRARLVCMIGRQDMIKLCYPIVICCLVHQLDRINLTYY
jgi:hypothetical protein